MNLSSEEIRNRIATEPDFVNIKRFDYSLEKVLERYPEGAPIKIIAQALHVTAQEVEETLEKVINKLRQKMKVDAV
jgi:hypothetical protein